MRNTLHDVPIGRAPAFAWVLIRANTRRAGMGVYSSAIEEDADDEHEGPDVSHASCPRRE